MPSTRAQTVVAVGFAVKPVGKPDAGNPHVRFDERGRETGHCHRARPRLYRSKDVSATSPWTRKGCCSAWSCTPPPSRTRTALAACSGASSRCVAGCGQCSPTAATTVWARCSPASCSASPWSSSSVSLARRALSCCRAGGLWERTLGWLGRWRRLSKDYERLPEVSEAMVTLAMIRLMLQRVAHPNRKRLPAP